jgi:NodT family efflux transporter outer membrane factor (OMF) lipoprotein
MNALRRCSTPAAVLTAALLGACAAGPDFVAPTAPAADRYTDEPPAPATAAGATQRFAAETMLPAEWWRLFRSPALDALVARALAASPTLQAAEARLRVSRDNLRAGQGVFYPQLGLGADATRERSAPALQGSSLPGSVFNITSANVGVSYTLDLFGAQRRSVESLGALVEAQSFTTRAAYLSLTANVVNAGIARAAYGAELHATEQLIALQLDQLRALEMQERAGIASHAAVLTQASLIAASRAGLAPLRQRRDQADHLLALLVGAAPAGADLPDVDFDSIALPAELPLILPSELVHQRPDIRAAEAQLHAASAQIGVASAALLPSVGLSAAYGRAGNTLADLLGAAGNPFWSIGPSLAVPLFRGGTLRAQRQAAIDAYDAEQANYRQTVLAAFAQVADALRALQHDAEALDAQLEAQRTAAEALHLLQANQRAGLVAGIDVLAAEVQLRNATLAAVQAAAQRQQDTVALFAALGGGWWNAPDARADAKR